MKNNLLAILAVTFCMTLMGCPDFPSSEKDTSDKVISLFAIPGIAVPEIGATPETNVTTDQYVARVYWEPDTTVFEANTEYTATIEISPKAGWTLKGVPANCFTVSGATTTNAANSGTVTAVFPKL